MKWNSDWFAKEWKQVVVIVTAIAGVGALRAS
jgi:hypothetical protein